MRCWRPPIARFAVIAGVGQETVTAVTRRGDDFLYTLTRHGDGTVPLASAQLPGAASAYARTAHSELTRDPQVAAAVVDLLRHGATTRLPRNWRSTSRARTQVSDRRLRASHAHKVNWAALTPEERRLFLENLNEPPRFRLRCRARRAVHAAARAGSNSRAFAPRPRGSFRRTAGRSPRAGAHRAAGRGRRPDCPQGARACRSPE